MREFSSYGEVSQVMFPSELLALGRRTATVKDETSNKSVAGTRAKLTGDFRLGRNDLTRPRVSLGRRSGVVLVDRFELW